MDEREVTSRVLEEDEDLVGFDTSKYVFTDITFGVPGNAGQAVSSSDIETRPPVLQTGPGLPWCENQADN